MLTEYMNFYCFCVIKDDKSYINYATNDLEMREDYLKMWILIAFESNLLHY